MTQEPQTETESEDMRIEIINTISKLPNLTKRIEALKQSPNFKDLGEALSPIFIATKIETEDWPMSKQVQAIAKEERKENKLKQRMQETGAEVLAFMGGGSTNKEPEQPTPIAEPNPLVCQHCGQKLKPSMNKCPNCGAPVLMNKSLPLPLIAKIIPHNMHFLDFFAGAVVFVMWAAATAWIISSFGLSFASVIGLGLFWIAFIVVYRVVAGGILD